MGVSRTGVRRVEAYPPIVNVGLLLVAARDRHAVVEREGPLPHQPQVVWCSRASAARPRKLGLGTCVPYITSAPRERAYIGACLAFARECLR